jgi:hypothetical protein
MHGSLLLTFSIVDPGSLFKVPIGEQKGCHCLTPVSTATHSAAV